MKVAKCCESKESKEPELLTFEQIKEVEGIYQAYGYDGRLIVLTRGQDIARLYLEPNGSLDPASDSWDCEKFRRTSETLCVGLKDAAGKWVE